MYILSQNLIVDTKYLYMVVPVGFEATNDEPYVIATEYYEQGMRDYMPGFYKEGLELLQSTFEVAP